MAMEGMKRIIELPELIPVLPVRNTVLFPNAAVPLIVGRPRSVQTVRRAQQEGEILLVVAQKDATQDDPKHDGLYSVGVVCLISKLTAVENDSFQLIANGLFRFRIREFVDAGGPEGVYLAARGAQIAEIVPTQTQKLDTLAGEIKQLGKSILNLAAIPGSDALVKLFAQIDDASQIADLCCTFLNLPISLKQEMLEQLDLEKRLEQLLDIMVREKEKLALQGEIQAKMMERLSKDQRDHLLREQLKTIHEELGDESGTQLDFARRIEEAGLSPEAQKVAKDELSRLAVVQRSSPEYHVIRTYLDTLLSMPWKKFSAPEQDKIDLAKARQILDEDHFGIDKVKSRIIQFLAVTKLKNDLKGPILCLIGPPGVGKTSIAKSIARALGRNFTRTSLGGVRDEAEIRGHRRTYIGAMPGRLMQSLRRTGVKDPLILLDEIDKIGSDFRGDPASALLEVLDPEQNSGFLDHYLDVPFDLSRVFFVTTANFVDNIPPALRDRLEIIEMSSYSKAEKLVIATRHLVPKLLSEHGIRPDQVELPEATISDVIEGWTREAGVRNLTRELAHLLRAAAEELARENPVAISRLTPDRLDNLLGPRPFHTDEIDENRRPGVVTGLAWTPVGGEILNVEVSRMDGRGHLILTGQLGDVMKESARIALSVLREHAKQPSPVRFERSDFHLHVPAGAIPKDGPSAGAAIFLALASLVEGKPVDTRFAVTGELTLRGNILPVGGIKEKVLAAHRAGIKTVCLPKRNEPNLRDVSDDVKKQMTFHFVSDVAGLLKAAGIGGPFLDALTKPPSDLAHLTTN